MSRALIYTVGTSLLTNRDHPLAGWKPRPRDPFHDPTIVDHRLETADVTHASAETKTLKAIDVDEADTLALLHSDTDEGTKVDSAPSASQPSTSRPHASSPATPRVPAPPAGAQAI